MSPGLGETLIVAHRGASADAPENTLAAFQEAWRQGADAIEGDFWLTKDGRIVTLHDATTKRTAIKEFIVAETDWTTLKDLDVGVQSVTTNKPKEMRSFLVDQDNPHTPE